MLPEEGASPPEVFRGLLEAAAPAFGLTFSTRVSAALSRFLSELDLWRRRTNLTGPIGLKELTAHTLEAVLGQKLIVHGARVIDIGAGAGFPGIPLAIARPDLEVTLLEPRKKRATFLRHAARSVPVGNARVVEGRTTDLSGDVFDVATSRAVGGIAEILGEAPFLNAGGAFLAWTTDSEALCRRLSPGFSLKKVEPVPGSQRRAIVSFRKNS